MGLFCVWVLLGAESRCLRLNVRFHLIVFYLGWNNHPGLVFTWTWRNKTISVANNLRINYNRLRGCSVFIVCRTSIVGPRGCGIELVFHGLGFVA